MAFPFSRMAAPGIQRTRYITQEVLQIILQRGSGNLGEEADVAEHDRDSEDEVFEDAQVEQNSDDDETSGVADDSFNHVVSFEGAASVPDNE